MENTVSNSFGAIVRPQGSQGVSATVNIYIRSKKRAFQNGNVDLNEPNGQAMLCTAQPENPHTESM